MRSVPAEPVDLEVHLLHEHLVVQRHVAVDDALVSKDSKLVMYSVTSR